METLREKILHILEDNAEDNPAILASVRQLAGDTGDRAYSEFFHVLTGIDLQPAEAAAMWHKVTEHHSAVSKALGRSFCLRIAIFDYFCTVEKIVTNPKIIDARCYETTIQHAKYDHLTSLMNRRYFEEILKHEISRADRHENDLSLLFFDLDDFKTVNDSYGHEVGDKMLQWFAAIIQRNKRGEDAAARFGGDEFVLILPQTSKTSALLIGERIRRQTQKSPFSHNDTPTPMTVSCGLAAFPYDVTDAAKLLQYADEALYRAKAVGKNFICMFSHNMRRHVRIPFTRDIKVGEINSSGTTLHKAVAKNLSGNGLLFESNREYPVKSLLQAVLSLDEAKPLLLAGKVIHCRKVKQNLFHTGLCLQEADPSTRMKISAYILGRSTMQTHLSENPF